MKLYYAQNKEDLLIKDFFPDVKNGLYIDIGANDPLIDSVTKLFYDDGWRGINIDPIHKHILDLNKLRPKDINIEVGISNEEGEKLFTEFTKGDGLSTFAQPMKDFYKHTNDFPTISHKDYMVPIKTLTTVLKENKIKQVHFIKIDVEGYEYEVIDGYDWKDPRPELICVEASHIFKDWRPLIESKNYEIVFFDGINNYYLAKEALHRKKYFQYPNAVLAGDPIYYQSYLEVSEKITEREKDKWQAREDLLMTKLVEKEQAIAIMVGQQRDVRLLAKRLHAELLIRLNRRANSYKPKRAITYKEDPEIARLIKKDTSLSANEALNEAHRRDKGNVEVKGRLFSSYFKAWFWKLATNCYILLTKTAKRAVS